MKILPVRPNLDFLLREAKAVKSAHRNADTGICVIIGHYDTSLHGLTNKQIFDTRFSILDAQRVVARQYGFASWSRLKQFVNLCDKGKHPSDPSLRDYIQKRHKLLLALQKDVKSKKKSYEEFTRETVASTDVLSSAYDIHGWPGPDVIGADCVEAAWFVAASALYDAEFQRNTVDMTTNALADGKLFGYCHAGVKDRYLTLTKKPTQYGLAFGAYYDSEGEFQLCIPAIEDPENVDKRRATVGHISLKNERDNYAREARENNWKYGNRADALKELDRISSEAGYTQA